MKGMTKAASPIPQIPKSSASESGAPVVNLNSRIPADSGVQLRNAVFSNDHEGFADADIRSGGGAKEKTLIVNDGHAWLP